MTRSVAEIIGWELVHHERHGYMMRTPDGELWRASKTPTADDLLAWLREQGVMVSVGACRYDDGPTSTLTHDVVHLEVVQWSPDGALETRRHYVEAPTLLAALEAAVRAVAGEP